jgi:hypothetical protein
MKSSGIDVSKIGLEAAAKYYEESRKEEWVDIFKRMERKGLKLSDEEIQEEITKARQENGDKE